MRPSPALLLCARDAVPTAGLAHALRARHLAVQCANLPAARLGGAAAATASDRLVARGRRALGRLDAVVIRPMQPRRAGARHLSWREWQTHLDGSLRAAFFTARAATRALRQQGSGSIVLVIDSAAVEDAVGCVVRDGLLCLADGLATAAVPAVQVGRVLIEPHRQLRLATADEPLADAIQYVLCSSAAVCTVRLRTASRGGRTGLTWKWPSVS